MLTVLPGNIATDNYGQDVCNGNTAVIFLNGLNMQDALALYNLVPSVHPMLKLDLLYVLLNERSSLVTVY